MCLASINYLYQMNNAPGMYTRSKFKQGRSQDLEEGEAEYNKVVRAKKFRVITHPNFIT